MKKKVIAFLLVVVLMLSNSLTVLAAPIGSGTGDDGPAATKKIEGGPTSQKVGWLVYGIDWNGNQITPTQVIYEYQTPNCNAFYPTTKFGGSINYGNYEVGSPWGYGPFNSDASANGSKLKSWMLQEKGDTFNCLVVIDKYFGADYCLKFKNQEMLLIVEALYWCQMYRDDIGATGIFLCATAHGWADMQERIGTGEYGSKAIGKYTNNIFPNCVKLEHTLYLTGRPN